MSPNQRDYVRYKVIQILDQNPHATQRELAVELGVSLGAINFCIKALVEKGLVKVQSFMRSDNKLAYAYILTPKGVVEKSEITSEFLQRKKQEYVILKQEIIALQEEYNKLTANQKMSKTREDL